ncbi:MAG TPA: hypothetical protein VNA25_14190 [Phycisphaerae bacterium]|nr:hypothetical protein [Phycisphaerae bacterium]
MTPTFVDGVDSIIREVEFVEQHVHNRERWFGKSADQSGNDWALESGLTVYRAISGNGVFGADANDEAKLLGSADTPFRTGMVKYDAHRLMVSAVSNANDCVLRLIWGTGTMAAAETALQYSDLMITDAKKGGPIPVIMRRIAVGTLLWARLKNGTDNATIDFFLGIHEYDL